MFINASSRRAVVRTKNQPSRSSNALLALFLLLIHSGSFLASGAAADDTVVVVDWKWASAVDKERREPVSGTRSAPSTVPIYLWTQLKAGKETLENLKSTLANEAYIRHRWWRSVGPHQELTLSDDPDLIVKPDTAAKFALDDKGFFTWRIWSKKENVESGYYEVEIKDKNGGPVLCRYDSAQLQPCLFQFTIP